MSGSNSGSNPFFDTDQLMGVCYSPYHQAGKAFGDYTKADIRADMALIADHFSFIRTYTVQNANQYIVDEAKAKGVQVALGAWIFPGDATKTQAEIDTVLSQAAGATDTVKIIVIGNEVDLASAGYTPAEVKTAFEYAVTQKATHSALADVPLTVCFTGTGPMQSEWKPVLDLCQTCVFLTIYPWWAPTTPDPDNISANMQWSYDNGISQAEAAGLAVIIGEIGWPSAGVPAKKTTVANEFTNYATTCSWVQGNNAPIDKSYVTFWFEMFDEPWKTAEGAQGPYWGLYTDGASPTSKATIPACDVTGS